jgi:hypothetical protein
MSAAKSKLTPDAVEIRRALDVLFEPSQVIELRAFGTKYGTCVGFYTDRDKLATDAVKISENVSTPAVFWTLQEINPELLSRSPNTFQRRVGQGVATADTDVMRYRWLLIDCDPLRNPAKTSSTDAEKADALKVATDIRGYFSAINGFDGYESVLADSGNGYHVLLRIDLDSSADSKTLYSLVLHALNHHFSTGDTTSGTKIDVSVVNPSRICKIYGTVVRKGPATEDRPYRMAHLLDVPSSLSVVPRDVLERIAAQAPTTEITEAACQPAVSSATIEKKAAKMEQFLKEAKMARRSRMEYDGGGVKWQLNACPFNPEHKAPDSYVFIRTDGAMGFKCSHNTCTENKWDQFRPVAEAVIGHQFEFVESGNSPPRENVGDYVHVGEHRNGKEMHPLLAKARAESLKFDMDTLVFNPTDVRETITPIIDGFLAEGDSALFVGAKKSEKSLFSLRLSLHIACGKNWYGHRNSRPRKVAYLDAENGGPTIGERYDAVIHEFSAEEQSLIHTNFGIIDGQKWADAGGSLDALDDYFWDWYAKKTADAEVHVLDCLYRFHSLEPKDSNGMLEVLTVLRMRLQNEMKNRTVVILNHTRSFSNDDLKKSSSMSLERLGSIGFSEQSFGTKSLLKYMTVVGCLDKQFKRDEDGVIVAEEVHFQFYGRKVSNGESVLMKFEPVDEGYARRLIRTLSKGAKSAAVELRMVRGENGAWSSKHAAAQDIKKASRSTAYRQLNELIVKGYLVEDAEGVLHLHISPDLAREISIAEEKDANFNAAREWLRGFVTQPMKAENVIDAGDEEGHCREDLVAAVKAAGLVEYEQPGTDTTMVGTLMWRPKKKRGGFSKGSEAAKKAAEKRWHGDEEQGELSATGVDIEVE